MLSFLTYTNIPTHTHPQVVTPQAQRDPDIRAAVADASRLQQVMRAVTPQLDDLAEAAELAALLDLSYAELASGEPVTKGREVAREASLALTAAFDWLGSNGPVRVIRSTDALLMWVSVFGMEAQAPFDEFSKKLASYIVQNCPGSDPKQARARARARRMCFCAVSPRSLQEETIRSLTERVCNELGTSPPTSLQRNHLTPLRLCACAPGSVQVGDRLAKVESAQARLRWHVDKDNKGAVTVMDVDRAFPPHISLVERVGTFIDTPPDTCAKGIVRVNAVQKGE